MKNITDYLVDEGSYEEDILLGKISLFFMLILCFEFGKQCWNCNKRNIHTVQYIHSFCIYRYSFFLTYLFVITVGKTNCCS